jgi:hypothetical protein
MGNSRQRRYHTRDPVRRFILWRKCGRWHGGILQLPLPRRPLSDSQFQILFVENDDQITNSVQVALEREGFAFGGLLGSKQ